ncbi:MAG: PAS domain-containing sensor histidine kinase [Steroidobacteraceae bacterium]
MTDRSSGSAPTELQALLDATVDAVIVIDGRGHIESFNRSGERLFGYSAAEVLGHNVSILMNAPDRDAHDGYMSRYLSSGVPHILGTGREVEARRKDGSSFPVFLSVGQIQGADPPRFIGLLHDLTLRREAMAALRRERDRANMYLEMAQVILLALSTDHRVQLINRKGCDTLARRELDLLGRDWLELAVPREQHAAVRAELQSLDAVQSGERYFEHDVTAADGARRLIAWRSIALRNSEGRVIGYFSSGEDITSARRAAEDSAEIQQRMTQVSHLATLGEMAAGIAHELNQPLAAIANFANAASRLPNETDIQDALKQISGQALRAGEIIRRLRTLVQNRETRSEPSSLNELVNEVLGFVQSDARLHSVKIHTELAAALPEIAVDRIQIQQLLLNLLRNSIEALDERPAMREIRLLTRRESEWVVVEVLDNGPGVPADLVTRIFDPFCTTKTNGTGLGLAISRTIAEAHHGRLRYRDAPAGGAHFILELPCPPGRAA